MRGSTDGVDEEMSAAAQRRKAIWQRRKTNALREHQAKLAQFEKQRAARKQAESERRAQIIQLSNEVKETLAVLESVSDDATKIALVAKMKALLRRMDELRKLEQPTTRRVDVETKQQHNAVQQILPDSIAAERLEKIAEVKRQLSELETQLQTEESSTDSQVELRRKITDLKRKVGHRVCVLNHLNNPTASFF